MFHQPSRTQIHASKLTCYCSKIFSVVKLHGLEDRSEQLYWGGGSLSFFETITKESLVISVNNISSFSFIELICVRLKTIIQWKVVRVANQF